VSVKLGDECTLHEALKSYWE